MFLINMIPVTDPDYTISPFVPRVGMRSIVFFETSCQALSTFEFSTRHVNVQNTVRAITRSSLRILMESSWKSLLHQTIFTRRRNVVKTAADSEHPAWIDVETCARQISDYRRISSADGINTIGLRAVEIEA